MHLLVLRVAALEVFAIVCDHMVLLPLDVDVALLTENHLGTVVAVFVLFLVVADTCLVPIVESHG